MKTYNLHQTYIMDKKFRGGYEVILVDIYGKLFGRVRGKGGDYEWDTMLNRLSEKE